jgi:hypothetical protein
MKGGHVGRFRVVVLLLAPLLAGCSAQASAEPPVPSAAVRWTGLAGECPDLIGPAARALDVIGNGRPTTEYEADGRDVVIPDCSWGPDGGDGMAVTVRMSIHRTQTAAAAEWQVVSAGQERKMPAVGDEAFSAVEMPALVIRTRSHNAVVTLRLVAPEDEATEELFEELRPAAAELTRDVLGDLR